jgi:cytosine/adenosine deaminase-related metal-dependent hydrolase
MKESPIFARTYDLLRWLLPVTVKFPRQQRFVLAEAVQRTALDFQERLIEAGLTQNPISILQQADVSLMKLRFYLRLCRDLELLSLGQYEHVSRMISEIGKLLGGWIKKVSG